MPHIQARFAVKQLERGVYIPKCQQAGLRKGAGTDPAAWPLLSFASSPSALKVPGIAALKLPLTGHGRTRTRPGWVVSQSCNALGTSRDIDLAMSTLGDVGLQLRFAQLPRPESTMSIPDCHVVKAAALLFLAAGPRMHRCNISTAQMRWDS